MHLGHICTITIPANSLSVPPTLSLPSLYSPFHVSSIYSSLSPIRADCVCMGMGPLTGTLAADQWPRMQRKTLCSYSRSYHQLAVLDLGPCALSHPGWGF